MIHSFQFQTKNPNEKPNCRLAEGHLRGESFVQIVDTPEAKETAGWYDKYYVCAPSLIDRHVPSPAFLILLEAPIYDSLINHVLTAAKIISAHSCVR